MPPENYATIEKVADGFRAAGDKMNGLRAEIEELKLFSKELGSKLRQAMRVASEGGSEFSGGGFWGSEEMALEFGKTVMSVARGDVSVKDLGERVDSLGGVMVPDEVARRFIDLLGRFGKFRKNALTFPLGSGSVTVPKIEQDLTVYCPGEGSDVTLSDMKFTGVKMIPKTWAALAAVSNELDDDSVVAIGEIVGYSIARSMARQEDKVGFLGDGTAEYFGHTGILGAFLKLASGDSANFGNVAGMLKGTGTTGWAGLVLDDFVDLAGLLPEEYDDGAKWYCSKRFYYGVMYGLAAAEAGPIVSLFCEQSGE